MKRPLKVPAKLAYSVLRMAVAGTVACSGSTAQQPASDAGEDAMADAQPADATTADAPSDAPQGDACTAQVYCGPQSGTDAAACPGFVCDTTACPPGCEPFV